MRYQMKQKLLSWGDDYHICDADGNEKYFVDGKAFTIGAKLSFQDLSGNELAYIEQKLFRWGLTYEIYRNGVVAAVVKKELFQFFHHRFTVDVPGPDDLEIEGSFLDYEYEFKRGDSVVASVSKKWLSFRDSYGIDVQPGEDDILILASAVVVDQACHPDDGQRH